MGDEEKKLKLAKLKVLFAVDEPVFSALASPSQNNSQNKSNIDDESSSSEEDDDDDDTNDFQPLLTVRQITPPTTEQEFMEKLTKEAKDVAGKIFVYKPRG